jgi:DNA recombination protein RmuC
MAPKKPKPDTAANMDGWIVIVLIVFALVCGAIAFLWWKAQVQLSLAQSRLEDLRSQTLREGQLVDRVRGDLIQSLHELAQQSLAGNSKQFLELAKSSFEKEHAQAQSQMEKLTTPLQGLLETYQKHVREIEKERQTGFARIEGEMKRMIESTALLSQETQGLKSALKRPHVRGRWGELQLRNCVELAGMSEFADVQFQDANEGDEQRLIPDMTVRMPGGRRVVVDAKTPLDAFLSALEATKDEQKSLEMGRHGRQVKEHVRKLSQKAYGENLKDSPDFTVMFLPNESFLYAALESVPDLVEYALQKKILIATPPTLIGLLKVIRFGWNEERLAENAARISAEGMELHKRLCDFVEAFVDLGKHLTKARTEYDSALSRLESRVIVQARRLEKLGAKSIKSLPEGMGESESTPS